MKLLNNIEVCELSRMAVRSVVYSEVSIGKEDLQSCPTVFGIMTFLPIYFSERSLSMIS